MSANMPTYRKKELDSTPLAMLHGGEVTKMYEDDAISIDRVSAVYTINSPTVNPMYPPRGDSMGALKRGTLNDTAEQAGVGSGAAQYSNAQLNKPLPELPHEADVEAIVSTGTGAHVMMAHAEVSDVLTKATTMKAPGVSWAGSGASDDLEDLPSGPPPPIPAKSPKRFVLDYNTTPYTVALGYDQNGLVSDVSTSSLDQDHIRPVKSSGSTTGADEDQDRSTSDKPASEVSSKPESDTSSNPASDAPAQPVDAGVSVNDAVERLLAANYKLTGKRPNVADLMNAPVNAPVTPSQRTGTLSKLRLKPSSSLASLFSRKKVIKDPPKPPHHFYNPSGSPVISKADYESGMDLRHKEGQNFTGSRKARLLTGQVHSRRKAIAEDTKSLGSRNSTTDDPSSPESIDSAIEEQMIEQKIFRTDYHLALSNDGIPISLMEDEAERDARSETFSYDSEMSSSPLAQSTPRIKSADSFAGPHFDDNADSPTKGNFLQQFTDGLKRKTSQVHRNNSGSVGRLSKRTKKHPTPSLNELAKLKAEAGRFPHFVRSGMATEVNAYYQHITSANVLAARDPNTIVGDPTSDSGNDRRRPMTTLPAASATMPEMNRRSLSQLTTMASISGIRAGNLIEQKQVLAFDRVEQGADDTDELQIDDPAYNVGRCP